MKGFLSFLPAVALVLAPAANGRTPALRWTLAHARAYLVSHELDLVDRTQRDHPEFDVRFTAAAVGRLVPIGSGRRITWTEFRFNGQAHDVIRDVDVRLRFVLRPAPTGVDIRAVRGPPPNRAQPRFPIRATFYYGWFPEAWNQEHVDPFTLYHPTLGFYNSGDPSILRNQIAAMRYAHISAAIYSWWGQGSSTDSRFPLALTLARQTPLRWAVYYEAEGYGDPSVAQIHADLVSLRAHSFNRPAYLHIAARPVVFAYGDGSEDCTVAQRWHDANQGIGAYLVLSAFGAREHIAYEAYGASNPGGVRVAAGDVDGDGRAELITAPGPGASPVVKVFRRDGSLIASFAPGTAQGISLAAADLDGDGKAEVITGSDANGIIHVFDIVNGGAVERASFATGLPGTRVATGDVNGDGRPEIVAAATSGPPMVKVFDASGNQLSSFLASESGAGPVSIAVGNVIHTGSADIVIGVQDEVRIVDESGAEVYPAFRPYADGGGEISVAAGDTNGDGRADVVTDGASAPVRIFSLLGSSATQFAQFAAFDPSFQGSVSLAAADTNGNGTAEVIAGAPPGHGGEVRLLYGFRDCADQPDGWHSYDSAHPESYLPPYQFGVSPGFERVLVRPGDPSLMRDPTRWDQDVADMNASPLPWHLVLTFNEWGEGTAIESAQEWATPSGYGAYLDALHNAP